MNSNETGTAIKKMRMAALSCAAAAAALLSCTGTEPNDFDRDEIVVQAYLFAGRPVSDVRLLHLVKSVHDTMVEVVMYRDTTIDTIDTALTIVRDSTVDNAEVIITSGGVSHGLAFRDSGWYRDTSGLAVVVGRTYRIDVYAYGRHAWAVTTVPSPVGGLSVSRDTLYSSGGQVKGNEGKYVTASKDKPPLDTTPGTTTEPVPDSLTYLIAKWNNPARSYLYYRCIQDTNLPYRVYNGNYIAADSLKITSSSYMYMPATDSTMTVVGYLQPGRYKLVLYTTTPDYRRMLETIADSTRQDLWTRSPNNIVNGLGFFTSFSSDSVNLTVIGKDDGSGGKDDVRYDVPK